MNNIFTLLVGEMITSFFGNDNDTDERSLKHNSNVKNGNDMIITIYLILMIMVMIIKTTW